MSCFCRGIVANSAIAANAASAGPALSAGFGFGVNLQLANCKLLFTSSFSCNYAPNIL